MTYKFNGDGNIMRLTVIGYWEAYPDKNEATSRYLLQGDKYNILIDCGSGVLSKVQNYIDLTEIDTIILSYYDGDHAGDTIGKKIDDNTVLSFGDLKVSFKWSKHTVHSLAMRFEEKGKIVKAEGGLVFQL